MNRDMSIKIRVSPDEYLAIKNRAKTADMNISKFIRTLALKGKVILYNTENIYRFNQLMRSIGTNINQIAMVVNSEKSVFKADIDNLRKEVGTLSEEFHSIVSPLSCDFNHFSLEYYRGKKDADGDDCFEIMKSIYEFCRNYAESFSLKSESLLMYGKTGVGKTHLSLSIAKAVAERGFNAAYGSIVNLLTIIEREHFGKVSEEENMDTVNLLINADLLVLDDLGAEFSSQFYESVTYNIINSRINLGLPTIISTNLTAAELQKKYNERIISRIFGEFSTLCLVGEDIRQIKRLNGEL